MKTYKVPVQKFYLPYKYLNCFKVLSETTLPPYEAFFSQLNGENTLHLEYQEYENKHSFDSEGSRPRTGPEV